MSGSNPFRRSRIIAASETFPSIPNNNNNDAIAADVNIRPAGVFDTDPKLQLPPQPKTVRIATPPILSPAAASTSSSSYFPAATLATTRAYQSPPPPENSDSESSDDYTSNPFNPQSSATGHDDNPVEVVEDPRHQSTGTRSHDSIPVNSLDSHQSVTEEFRSRVPDINVESDRKSNGPLDVDAFTRLLLTGNADEVSKSDQAVIYNASSGSSDIETVSVTQHGNPDSVVTSNTSTSVHSLKTEPNEIQRTTSLKRPKPPPPKTRHGKPIKPEESSQSSRKSSGEVNPSGESSQQRTLPEMSILPAWNTREVLPSAPDVKSPSIISDSSTNDDVPALHRAPSQSKRPPTPPLARRHSQIKPNMKKSSRETLHRISMPPKGLGLELPGPPSPGAKTPPKPPSRRSEKYVAGSQTDSFPQPKSSLSQQYPAPSSNLPAEGPGSAASSSPPSRPPSIKRTTSGSAPSGPLMPPPPPPPRRLRASSKGSSNSGQSTALQAKNAEDPDDKEVPPSSHAQDILADLSRLQQEVDNLRGHYESRKVSQ